MNFPRQLSKIFYLIKLKLADNTQIKCPKNPSNPDFSILSKKNENFNTSIMSPLICGLKILAPEKVRPNFLGFIRMTLVDMSLLKISIVKI